MIDNTDITVFITESFRNESELTDKMIIDSYMVILTYISTALEVYHLDDPKNLEVIKLLKMPLIDFSHGV